MKRLLALCALVTLSAVVCRADDFCSGLVLPSAFEGCRVAAGGSLYLKAGKGYKESKNDARAVAAGKVLSAWLAFNPQAGNLLAVEGVGQGELWSLDGAGKPRRVDTWSDESIRTAQKTAAHGRLFAYLGGQLMAGGDYPSKGFTARLGTTLFKNRYDAALSYSHNSYNDIANSGSDSVGLVARALLPLSRHTGWNFGGQLNYSKAESVSGDWTPSALCGINIYLPQGSLDMTVTYGEQGSRSLQLGYTIYLSK